MDVTAIDLLRWLHVLAPPCCLAPAAASRFHVDGAPHWRRPTDRSRRRDGGNRRHRIHGNSGRTATDHRRAAGAGHRLASQHRLDRAFAGTLPTGAFWLPVVRIQIRLRNLAREAVRTATPLPAQYTRLFRIWLACGVPAFAAVLTILWLMLKRPGIVL